MSIKAKYCIDLVCTETPVGFMGAKRTDKGGKQVKGEVQPNCRRKQDGKEEGQRAWEKVLYKNQPYPDNYTNGSILSDLVLNAHVQPRDYWTVVLGSAAIVQQISTVAMVASVAAHLFQKRIPIQGLFSVCCGLLIAGFLLCCFVGNHILGGTLARGVRQCLLLTGGVYLLSPLLQTLTLTISDDTIVSSSCLSLVIHLYLHDYNFVNSVTDKLTGSVSFGFAVFSSVLMGSRLSTSGHVFVHILFSLELYLLSPFVRRYIYKNSTSGHLVLSLAMLSCSMALIARLSTPLLWFYCIAVGFVSLLCPLFLVKLHKFKAKINGPWDEAIPKVSLKVS